MSKDTVFTKQDHTVHSADAHRLDFGVRLCIKIVISTFFRLSLCCVFTLREKHLIIPSFKGGFLHFSLVSVMKKVLENKFWQYVLMKKPLLLYVFHRTPSDLPDCRPVIVSHTAKSHLLSLIGNI